MAWFLTLFLHHGIIMFFDQVLNQTCSSTGSNQLPVLHSITLLRIQCKNAGLAVLEFPICILSAISLYDYGISKPNFLQFVLKNNWLQIIHCPIEAFTVIQVGYDYWESPINGWHFLISYQGGVQWMVNLINSLSQIALLTQESTQHN